MKNLMRKRVIVKAFRASNPQSVTTRFKIYINAAKKRHLIFELSKKQFKIIVNSSCHYCGRNPSKFYNVGVDRVNSAKGYLIDNVVPSCWPCNKWKGQDEFIDMLRHCKYVLEYNGFDVIPKDKEKLYEQYPNFDVDPIDVSIKEREKEEEKENQNPRIIPRIIHNPLIIKRCGRKLKIGNNMITYIPYKKKSIVTNKKHEATNQNNLSNELQTDFRVKIIKPKLKIITDPAIIAHQYHIDPIYVDAKFLKTYQKIRIQHRIMETFSPLTNVPIKKVEEICKEILENKQNNFQNGNKEEQCDNTISTLMGYTPYDLKKILYCLNFLACLGFNSLFDHRRIDIDRDTVNKYVDINIEEIKLIFKCNYTKGTKSEQLRFINDRLYSVFAFRVVAVSKKTDAKYHISNLDYWEPCTVNEKMYLLPRGIPLASDDRKIANCKFVEGNTINDLMD